MIAALGRSPACPIHPHPERGGGLRQDTWACDPIENQTMREILLIGLGFTLAGLLLGRVMRGRAPRFADRLHFGAVALVRVVAAMALGWGAAGGLNDGGAVHVGVAVLFCIMALGLLLTGIPVFYVAVKGREKPRT
jgi:hypothetical protein